MSSNIKSTILGFKPLIGREFEDPMSQGHISSLFNDVLKQDDGSIGFRVSVFLVSIFVIHGQIHSHYQNSTGDKSGVLRHLCITYVLLDMSQLPIPCTTQLLKR